MHQRSNFKALSFKIEGPRPRPLDQLLVLQPIHENRPKLVKVTIYNVYNNNYLVIWNNFGLMDVIDSCNQNIKFDHRCFIYN